jgi:dTDP-4-amino-4,6-dideoxygalactose transaminase
VKLVDVDPRTAVMSAADLERAITPRTRLVAPVHLYGQMAPMDEIAAVARRHGCLVLEDAAQAHGALWKGKPVGHWGDIAAYSFYPGKNLGAFGDAGAVVSRDAGRIRTVRALGNHGGIRKYEHEMAGFNSRLDNLQAAVLGVKLKFIDEWNESRRRVAGWYREGLRGVAGMTLLEEASDARSVYHLFPVLVENRDAFRAFLGERGVETGIHYPLAIHQLPAFRGTLGAGFPNAERLAARGVSLPLCPTLNERQVSRVIDVAREFFHG